jgi:hypothetical protein
MAYDTADLFIAQGVHKYDHVANEARRCVLTKILGVPAGGAAITSQVGGYNMISGDGERQYGLTPGKR